MRRFPGHSGRWVLLFALALIATPLLAQGPGGPGPRGHHGHGPDGEMHWRALEQLDLTDDQREQIHQLLTDHRNAMKEPREQMRARHEALQDLLRSDTVDEDAIRGAVMAGAEAHADIAVAQARLHQQIQAVLTPEQREKAEQMRRDRRERREAWGEGFREGRRFQHKRHKQQLDQDQDD
jgi:Spy/CpxP family protein refolding chaperone